MTETAFPIRIYLIRHATPDWKRKDIPYDIPPGPPLVPLGEAEAYQLGEFIQKAGIKKLYYSPLERARRTAEISAKVACVDTELENEIAEWRFDEDSEHLAFRFLKAWNRAVEASKKLGTIGLVTHGGPVGFMLQELGLPADLLEHYRSQFDHRNPLPPAGAWVAEKSNDASQWKLELAFIPTIT
jgi:probable phosphoglycerate mutase